MRRAVFVVFEEGGLYFPVEWVGTKGAYAIFYDDGSSERKHFPFYGYDHLGDWRICLAPYLRQFLYGDVDLDGIWRKELMALKKRSLERWS